MKLTFTLDGTAGKQRSWLAPCSDISEAVVADLSSNFFHLATLFETNSIFS